MNRMTKHCLKGWLLRIEQWTPFGVFSTRLFEWDIVELTGVSSSTARRWIRKPKTVPKNIYALLQFRALGLLADPEFSGFCVKDGSLYTANGTNISAPMIQQTSFIYAQNSFYRQAIDRLNTEADELKKAIDYWRSQSDTHDAANDSGY